jgi:uncharacterized coiled-coil protein SlyX
MSDATATSLITGMVTITTMIVGFLTLWAKLRYGADKAEQAADNASRVEGKLDANASRVEGKLDANTKLTEEAKEAAEANAGARHDGLAEMAKVVSDHGTRIAALETRLTAMEAKLGTLGAAVETANKNIDSTRHEMRGHLQAIMNKLDILGIKQSAAAEKKGG